MHAVRIYPRPIMEADLRLKSETVPENQRVSDRNHSGYHRMPPNTVYGGVE